MLDQKYYKEYERVRRTRACSPDSVSEVKQMARRYGFSNLIECIDNGKFEELRSTYNGAVSKGWTKIYEDEVV